VKPDTQDDGRLDPAQQQLRLLRHIRLLLTVVAVTTAVYAILMLLWIDRMYQAI
jgi:hypothetical protein